MDNDPRTPTKRRTVEEAIAQADAKERFREALAVRKAGFELLLGGIWLLARWRTWQHSRIDLLRLDGALITDRPVVGFAMAVVGPIVALTGAWLLRRAYAIAGRDPVTAIVLDQMRRRETQTSRRFPYSSRRRTL